MAKKRKLYIVGIDSVPVWIISEACKKYPMSGFTELINKGFLKDMETTLPPVTAAAWPSIYTGAGPGTHGMMEFFSLDKEYSKQLLFYNSAKHPPFWNLLSKSGIKSLIITPAMVLDVIKDDNVDLITGFPLPPKYSSKELQHAAQKIGFVGEENIEGKIKNGSMSIEEGSNIYLDCVKKRAALAKDLMEKKDYDLVFVCFTETDRIQHYAMGKGVAKALEYNAPLLKEISLFMEWLQTRMEKEDSVMMVLSDHGAQGLQKRFLLNSWLINNNYASLKSNIAEQVDKIFLSATESKKLEKNMKYRIREGLLMAGAEKVYGKMPTSLKKLAAKSMDTGLATSGNGKYVRVHDLNFDNFDMQNTKAFGSISTNPVGMIWINDKRFDNHSVTDKEKATIKKELMDKLAQIKDENGKKLVENVYDGAEYYKNTREFIAPDILIYVKEGYGIDTFNFSKSTNFIDVEGILNGDHTKDAMLGILGKSIKPASYKNRKVSVYDISPTVLHYFDVKTGPSEGDSLI